MLADWLAPTHRSTGANEVMRPCDQRPASKSRPPERATRNRLRSIVVDGVELAVGYWPARYQLPIRRQGLVKL